jgi:glyoxylase-like metal-dependent hydrolase (beta-lactamase superfamily II)
LRVFTLHARNPGPITGGGNWTYVVPGARPLLIDAGVGHPEHLTALDEVLPGGAATVVVTHAHSDHASGAQVLSDRWPRAEFCKMPWPERDLATVPWRSVGEGAVFETEQGPLQALHTPGHAPDHLVLWHEATQTLFGADLLLAGTTVTIPARHGGDLAAYLASLRRIRALRPRVVLPAHGAVIHDAVALIDSYLHHRQQREDQVVAALAAGLETIEAIAARIYPMLDPALVPLAREGVLAHLRKLAHEGRAETEGELWQLIG